VRTTGTNTTKKSIAAGGIRFGDIEFGRDSAPNPPRRSPRRGGAVVETEVIRMRQGRRWTAVIDYGLFPVIALLSLLLAACNNGGKGPGY
jgi:hypothetical protein